MDARRATLSPPSETFLRQLDAHHRYAYAHDYPTGPGDPPAVEFIPKDLDLSRTDFTNLNLGDLWWNDCTLDGSRLRDVFMPGTRAYDTTWRACDFTRAWIVKSEAEGCDFSGANFREANLIRFRLSKCDIRDAELTGAKLARFSLSECDARGLRIHATELDRLWLDGSHVAGLDLTGCKGTVTRPGGKKGLRINIGAPDDANWLEGDSALEWLRSCGAPELTLFDIDARPG